MIFIKEHILATQYLHDHVVLHLSPFPARGRFPIQVIRTVEDGIETVRVYLRTSQFRLMTRVMVYTGLMIALISIIIRGFCPDVIHFHIFAEVRFMQLIARFLHIPTVITEHWTALCRPSALSPTRLTKAKKIYESCDLVLPVCEYLRSCIEENTKAKFPYQIIFNAVNDDVFFFNDSQIKAPSNSTIRLLTVARTEEPKDYPTLFRAIRILVDAGYDLVLDVIGDGRQRVEFEELTRALLIDHLVEFHGKQPKEVIAGMMRASKLFVLASKWENSPCVIGEALCCGLPVVASEVGGVPELISTNDGLTVPPNDPIRLANAMQQVLDNLERFDRVSISKRAISRFSYQAIGRQLDRVYRDIKLGAANR